MNLDNAQVELLKRMRGGDVLTCSRTSGAFWIDSYEQVGAGTAKSLMLTDMVVEDFSANDSYSVYYKLTELGKTIKI